MESDKANIGGVFLPREEETNGWKNKAREGLWSGTWTETALKGGGVGYTP